MRIYMEADYATMSKRAANIIAAEVIKKPDCVLGLATGSTPIATYKGLIEKYNNGEISFNSDISIASLFLSNIYNKIKFVKKQHLF